MHPALGLSAIAGAVDLGTRRLPRRSRRHQAHTRVPREGPAHDHHGREGQYVRWPGRRDLRPDRLGCVVHGHRQAQFGLAAADRRREAPELSTAVTGSDVSGREYDERYLMAAAESMLRAGYGHRQIERALSRMSPTVPSDSGRLGIFGSLRRLLALPTSKLHAPRQGTGAGLLLVVAVAAAMLSTAADGAQRRAGMFCAKQVTTLFFPHGHRAAQVPGEAAMFFRHAAVYSTFADTYPLGRFLGWAAATKPPG
jgi:hypothetical protein